MVTQCHPPDLRSSPMTWSDFTPCVPLAVHVPVPPPRARARARARGAPGCAQKVHLAFAPHQNSLSTQCPIYALQGGPLIGSARARWPRACALAGGVLKRSTLHCVCAGIARKSLSSGAGREISGAPPDLPSRRRARWPRALSKLLAVL